MTAAPRPAPPPETDDLPPALRRVVRALARLVEEDEYLAAQERAAESRGSL